MFYLYTLLRFSEVAQMSSTHAKKAYFLAGLLLVGIATAGIFVPLLPTTPLILLAAACFSRSSKKWQQWLATHRLFGPIIHNWHVRRCISKKTKAIALGSILLFGTYAIGFAIELPWVRVIGSIILLIGLITVLRIPTCET